MRLRVMQVAHGAVRIRKFLSGGRLHLANFHGVGAARAESAARLRIDHIRRRAFDGIQLLRAIRVQAGNGLQKSARIGVLWVIEDFAAGANLHRLTGLHDHNEIRVRLHHAQVVCN